MRATVASGSAGLTRSPGTAYPAIRRGGNDVSGSPAVIVSSRRARSPGARSDARGRRTGGIGRTVVSRVNP